MHPDASGKRAYDLGVAAHETPTERISAGDVAAFSLRLSGEEREALRLLVNERQWVKLKMKLERYVPKKRKARVS